MTPRIAEVTGKVLTGSNTIIPAANCQLDTTIRPSTHPYFMPFSWPSIITAGRHIGITTREERTLLHRCSIPLFTGRWHSTAFSSLSNAVCIPGLESFNALAGWLRCYMPCRQAPRKRTTSRHFLDRCDKPLKLIIRSITRRESDRT